jgi:hypothetical protein
MLSFIKGLGTNEKIVRPKGYLAISGLRRGGIPPPSPQPEVARHIP